MIEIIAILIGRVYMQIILNNTKKDLNNYLNRVNITQQWEVRYLPDPAKLLKTILKRKSKKKRRKKVGGKRRRKISNYGN